MRSRIGVKQVRRFIFQPVVVETSAILSSAINDFLRGLDDKLATDNNDVRERVVASAKNLPRRCSG